MYALDSPVVAPTLPIPQDGLLKDPPSFVTICTPQGLAFKVTCMQDCCTSISPACIVQELPFQLSTVYLCTTWRLDPKALASLPGFCIAVHLLLCSMHGCFKASSDCCHGRPSFVCPQIHAYCCMFCCACASRSKVVEAAFTSLDALMFDYFAL